MTEEGRRFRIAQVAPLWVSVPPATYGGIELMIHWLTEELVRRGHQVTLFASGDSRTTATLRSVCAESLASVSARGGRYEYAYYANANLVDALRHAGDFDIIHCHAGGSLLPLSHLSPTPMVHTIHTGVSDRSIFTGASNVWIAAISRAQLAAVGLVPGGNITIVYYGCDFDAYECIDTPGRYLAFLGRMGPHKGPVEAIQIARTAGLPLVLAGAPESGIEQRYFETNVHPLVDGKHVSYIGRVNHVQKNEFLKYAAALLFPVSWDEPFGMVMIEAMACGTPVIACTRGSVREIVDFGTTGFYAERPDELAAFIPRATELDRSEVRRVARGRFHFTRMVDAYLEVYGAAVRSSAAAVDLA